MFVNTLNSEPQNLSNSESQKLRNSATQQLSNSETPHSPLLTPNFFFKKTSCF